MENGLKVPPEQGITVGRIVHYTDANRDSGRMEPTPPLVATVLEVNEYTGKPTLKVDRLFAVGQAPKGVPATQGGARVLATMIIEEVEFCPQPAGTMAARGCWSWPVIVTTPPIVDCAGKE